MTVEQPASRAALVERLRRPDLRTVTRGEGYDPGEVDTFLARVLASLDGHGPTLSRRDVERARFTIRRFRERYDVEQVDLLLGELAAHLKPVPPDPASDARPPTYAVSEPAVRRPTAADHDLAHRLRHPRLSVVRWREGYRIDEVDGYLTRVADALIGSGPALTGDDVREVMFHAVRLKPGYEMQEVDRLLDHVVAHLESR